jgi:hypothetical protein
MAVATDRVETARTVNERAYSVARRPLLRSASLGAREDRPMSIAPLRNGLEGAATAEAVEDGDFHAGHVLVERCSERAHAAERIAGTGDGDFFAARRAGKERAGCGQGAGSTPEVGEEEGWFHHGPR